MRPQFCIKYHSQIPSFLFFFFKNTRSCFELQIMRHLLQYILEWCVKEIIIKIKANIYQHYHLGWQWHKCFLCIEHRVKFRSLLKCQIFHVLATACSNDFSYFKQLSTPDLKNLFSFSLAPRPPSMSHFFIIQQIVMM